MNHDYDFGVGLIVGVALVVVLLGLPAGCKCTALRSEVTGLRGEAVKRNHAEWIVDPETGSTTFAWKPLPGDPISPSEIERRSK